MNSNFEYIKKGSFGSYTFKFNIFRFSESNYRIYLIQAPSLTVDEAMFYLISDCYGNKQINWEDIIMTKHDAICILKVWTKLYVKKFEKIFDNKYSFPVYNDTLNKLACGTFESNPRFELKMTKQVYNHIKQTIGKKNPEQGGMLGMTTDTITHYIWDINAITTNLEYSPNTEFLETILDKWEDEDISFCGFIHSHPELLSNLSKADIDYGLEILKSFRNLDFIFLPIVTNYKGIIEIHPYKLDRDGNVEKVKLNIINNYKKHPNLNKENIEEVFNTMAENIAK